MTLDEAIRHCEEVAAGDGECAGEHRQLAGWLTELRQYRQMQGRTQNAKYREETTISVKQEGKNNTVMVNNGTLAVNM